MRITRKFILPILATVPLMGIATMPSPASIPVLSMASADSDSVVPVHSIIDEVIWVVGDEAILKSDVENMRMQAAMEGVKWSGDPDCTIPEQIAVQKLFVHQADIDSIEVTDADVAQDVEQTISGWLEMVDGSRERLEEYKHQTITEMRNEMRDEFKNRYKVQKMRQKLVEGIAVTPADVRRYFSNLPQDSLPFVQTEVEVQIICQTPRVEEEEINRVKEELREYTDRVNKGESTFQTLARLYSEDPASARRGPAFATVAFNLTDPKKISKIVESEFGYHIIQLVEKRGDKVNVRHILKKPIVSDEAIEKALSRLDSIADDIRAGKFTFEDGASMLSDDKDTRSNKGLMSNSQLQFGRSITSRFQMQDLPPEVAKVVDTMQVGQISKPFQMINQKEKTVCVIAKLKSRVDGHRANISDDYQVLKEVVLNKRREEYLHKWVVDKIKGVYTRLNDNYRDCKFEYEGWIK